MVLLRLGFTWRFSRDLRGPTFIDCRRLLPLCIELVCNRLSLALFKIRVILLMRGRLCCSRFLRPDLVMGVWGALLEQGGTPAGLILVINNRFPIYRERS